MSNIKQSKRIPNGFILLCDTTYYKEVVHPKLGKCKFYIDISKPVGHFDRAWYDEIKTN